MLLGLVFAAQLNVQAPEVTRLLDIVSSDAKGRAAATEQLGRIGAPAVAPAIERLRGADGHEFFWDEVFFKIDRPAVLGLARALSDPDVALRRRVAAILARFENETAAVMPEMIAALDTSDRNTRIFLLDAIESNRGLGVRDGALKKALVLVKDPDPEIAIRAASLLGSMGPIAGAAVPDIIRMFAQSDDDALRGLIAEALGGLGGSAASAETPLLEVLARTPPGSTLALQITEALRTIGAASPAAKAAILTRERDKELEAEAVERVSAARDDTGRLLAMLREHEPHLRDHAAGELLFKEGIDSRMVKLLGDDDLFMKTAAACVLIRHGKHDDAVNDALAVVIRSGNPQLIRQTLDELRGRAEHAEPLVPAMLDFLKASRDFVLREEVMRFMMVLHPSKDPASIPFLIEALSSEDHYTRANAASNLALLHGKGAVAAPRLIAMLADRNTSVRENAARALGEVAPGNPAAIRALAATLTAGDSMLKRAALEALNQSGSRAAEVAPQLRDALQREKGELHDAIVVTIGMIEPGSKSTVLLQAETLRTGKQSYAAYQLAGHADETLGTVLEVFSRATPQERAAMASNVKWIASLAHGPPKDLGADRVLEIIRMALADADHNVRLVGLTVAGKLGRNSASLAKEIALRLDDSDAEVRGAALDVVSVMGPESGPIVVSRLSGAAPMNGLLRRRLIAVLRSRNDSQALAHLAREAPVSTRRAAVVALAHSGPPDVAIPALAHALDDSDEEVVRAAIWSLAEWNARAQPQVPVLLRALGSKSRQVRLAAGRAIRRIESLGLNTLIDALHSDDALRHSGAAETLGLLFDRAAGARAALVAAHGAEAELALRRISMSLRQELEVKKLVPRKKPTAAVPEGERLRADLFIGADGRVIDVVIREGVSPEVNSAAVVTLSAWEFEPPMDRSSNAVVVVKTLTIGEERNAPSW